ncbi:MAG: hypothetical protein WHT84_08900 [Breznakiellaceae bacterium]
MRGFFSIKGGVLFFIVVFIVVGYALFDFLFSVTVNTIIEGKIEFSDKSSRDSNYYVFYYDDYSVMLKSGKTYSLELWNDPDIPIHFECDDLGQDLGAWSDNGKWDGYLLYPIPSSFTGKLEFDFYLRSDYVGSDSWYKFRINEK